MGNSSVRSSSPWSPEAQLWSPQATPHLRPPARVPDSAGLFDHGAEQTDGSGGDGDGDTRVAPSIAEEGNEAAYAGIG